MSEPESGCPALPWSDSFCTGVAALDADHRVLAQRINEICASWYAQQRDAALQALAALLTLAREHFQREEAVLRSLTGYPALSAHEGEHRTRLKQLTALVQRFHASSDAREGRELCTGLIDWFVRQSIGHDAAIKAYFDNGAGRFAERPRPAR